MNDEITRDDFVQQYASLPVSGVSFKYPKIICWATSSPIQYGVMQASATVLQRQASPSTPWEYIPSMNISCSQTDATLVDTNPFLDDSQLTLPPEKSFEYAIDAIYDKMDELIEKYDLLKK